MSELAKQKDLDLKKLSYTMSHRKYQRTYYLKKIRIMNIEINKAYIYIISGKNRENKW